MKVESEKISPCKVKLSVKMEAEETRPEYEKVFRIFSNRGRIPGFRPGKAPRAMVQKLFAKEITEEVQGRLIRDNYKKAVEEQQLRFVALTSVSGVAFSPEIGASFVLEVDVEPEFDLPKYKKLLYTTPIATAEDTAKVAGIDLSDKDFWRGALQTIADQIDLFCQLVEE